MSLNAGVARKLLSGCKPKNEASEKPRLCSPSTAWASSMCDSSSSASGVGFRRLLNVGDKLHVTDGKAILRSVVKSSGRMSSTRSAVPVLRGCADVLAKAGLSKVSLLIDQEGGMLEWGLGNGAAAARAMKERDWRRWIECFMSAIIFSAAATPTSRSFFVMRVPSKSEERFDVTAAQTAIRRQVFAAMGPR